MSSAVKIKWQYGFGNPLQGTGNREQGTKPQTQNPPRHPLIRGEGNQQTNPELQVFRRVTSFNVGRGDQRFKVGNGRVMDVGKTINFLGEQGESTQDPTTDAVESWIEIQKDGETKFIPVYPA